MFYQITSGLFSVMKFNFVSMITNIGMLNFKIHETGFLTNYAAMCRCYCMHFACLSFSVFHASLTCLLTVTEKTLVLKHFADVCIFKASLCRNPPESASNLDRYHHIVSTECVHETGLKSAIYRLTVS